MAAATSMFIADASLGRLVKWLRLLGYDTAYERVGGEARLVQRAQAEGRLLLTRNRRLLRRRGLPPHLFIAADDFRQQLRAVVDACGLDPAAGFLARCARCNTSLERLDHAAACAQVPAFVCATQTDFARCPRCARIYWPATHVARMRAELQRMGVGT